MGVNGTNGIEILSLANDNINPKVISSLSNVSDAPPAK